MSIHLYLPSTQCEGLCVNSAGWCLYIIYYSYVNTFFYVVVQLENRALKQSAELLVLYCSTDWFIMSQSHKDMESFNCLICVLKLDPLCWFWSICDPRFSFLDHVWYQIYLCWFIYRARFNVGSCMIADSICWFMFWLKKNHGGSYMRSGSICWFAPKVSVIMCFGVKRE